jgi:glycosyltransferase involved in cell wall biosynthesis
MRRDGPWAGKRIGYAPYSETLEAPGDRRRFVYWARHRDVPFEIVRPGEHYDLVVLSARADIARWSRRSTGGTKVVFDLIDSYLDEPMLSWRSLVRGSARFVTGEWSRWEPHYRTTLERMCRTADVVVCSTPEQKRRLQPLSRHVFPILDVQDDDVRTIKSDYEVGKTLHLVWEGLPYTLKGFRPIADALRSTANDIPLALHIVSALRFGQLGGRFRQRDTADVIRDILPGRTFLYEWNAQTVSQIVTACDLAIIPLDLADPFAAAKPENKLLYFWRLAMPTVTSATPAYRRVMSEAGLDTVCRTPDEWRRALEDLANDRDRRAHIGMRGHEHVRTHHSAEQALVQWDDAFRAALDVSSDR